MYHSMASLMDEKAVEEPLLGKVPSLPGASQSGEPQWAHWGVGAWGDDLGSHG
jgi:hypothetical protein